MIVNMLKGVSEMLDKSQEVKVQCAKIMLDKIIDGMKEPEYIKQKPGTVVPVKTVNAHPIEPQYEISVEHGRLVWIHIDKEDAPHDLPLLVDGVETTYGQAIGRAFQNGSLL